MVVGRLREHLVQQRVRGILNAAGAPTRVWRNNVGGGNVNGHWMTWGLAPGSADLIGIATIIINEDMIGQKIGQFFSAEIKTEKKSSKLRAEQIIWSRTVEERGGIARTFRSGEEAEAFLRGLTGQE